MTTSLNIHDVTLIRVGETIHFPHGRYVKGCKEFWNRTIEAEDKDCNRFVLTFISDLPASLLLPGEIPAEGEKVPQTAPQGPSGALEPAVLTDEQASRLLEQVSQTF